MEWTDALRKYAEMTGKKYRIYKKGTSEYDAIKKLQASGKGALTKKEANKKASEMMRSDKGKMPRKPRSDKGQKRVKGSIMGSDTGALIESMERSMPKAKKTRATKKRVSNKSLAGIMGSDTGRETLALTAGMAGGKKVRKVRSDKGKKRGPRSGLPADFSSETKEMAKKAKTLRFDAEGNIM